MTAQAQTIKVGAATLRIDRGCIDGVPVAVAELECEHSKTSAIVVQAGRQWSQNEVVKAVCRRALAETSCRCVEAVLAQYEAGF